MDDRTTAVDGTDHSTPPGDSVAVARWLRDELGLSWVKVGCSEGTCGSCTVLVEAMPVPSCLVSVARVRGAEITTLRGVLATPAGQVVARALLANSALQCGFCTPGLVVEAAFLLERGPSLGPEDLPGELAGHLCRCTGYQQISASVATAMEEWRRRTDEAGGGGAER